MHLKTRDRLSTWVLALILLLHAVALRGEFAISRLDHNDSIDHLSLIEGMVKAAGHGSNPLDWPEAGPFGYPFIRDYQPLAHALVAALYFASGKTVPILTIFAVVRYLAMVLLPLTFFFLARWLGLQRWTAILAAAIAPLVATASLYGIEYESYSWLGFGLFAQAVAVHLLLLTLGVAFRAIRSGRSLTLAGLLLGLTFIAQFIYGYMAAVTICLMTVTADRTVPWTNRVARTAAIGAVAIMISAFQLLPLIEDGRLINPMRPVESWKSDSFGASAVLTALFTGQILDHGRIPILSVLALVGIGVIVWRWRRTRKIDATDRLLLSGAVFWTLLLFGRPTWGPALRLLGVTQDFPLHRVVAAVQIFLVLLGAVGLSALAAAVAYARTASSSGSGDRKRPNRNRDRKGPEAGPVTQSRLAIAVAPVVILLLPVILERVDYLDRSRDARLEYVAAIEAERPDLDAVIGSVKQRGGYCYAGRPSWQAFRIGGWEMYLFLMAHGVPQISFSDHPIEMPWSMIGLLNDVQPAHYRLFNIASVILPPLKAAPPSFLTPRLSAGRFQVCDAPAVGLFDVVDVPAAVAADRYSAIDINTRWIQSGLVAQRAHLLLDFFANAPASLPHMSAADALPQDPNGSPPGEVSAQHRSGDIFEAQVTASRAAFALFRMTWHQKWKATLDGRAAKTYILSPGFIGVPVMAGTHRLAFRYQPDGWRLTLALAGLAAGLLLAVGEYWYRNKNGRNRSHDV
jgi:hypothetical protein